MPPLTPRVPVIGVAETPFQISTGTLHNTDEARNYMDPVIENDNIYLDLPAFFETFFGSVDGLPHLVDAVYARCLQSMARADAPSQIPTIISLLRLTIRLVVC